MSVIRVSVFAKLLVFIFTVLVGLNLYFSVLASQANGRLHVAFEQRYNLVLATRELHLASSDLTRWARAYIVTGNQQKRDNFFNEIHLVRRKNHAADTFIQLNAPQYEQDMISQVLELSNSLTLLKEEAINAKTAGDTELAIYLMFSDGYETGRLPIEYTLYRLVETVEQRTQLYLNATYATAAFFELAASISVIFSLIVSVIGITKIISYRNLVSR